MKVFFRKISESIRNKIRYSVTAIHYITFMFSGELCLVNVKQFPMGQRSMMPPSGSRTSRKRIVAIISIILRYNNLFHCALRLYTTYFQRHF
jgi:hypothetical protein